MIDLLTTKTDPAYNVSGLLKSVDNRLDVHGNPLYPNYPYEFVVYPIHRYTQAIRKDRDKGLLDNSSRRHIWKQFENYKISSGAGVGQVTIWDKQYGEPPDHVYYTSPPIPNSYGAYWYWTTLSGGPYEPFGEAGKLNMPTSVGGKTLAPPFVHNFDDGRIIAPLAEKNMLCNRALKAMLPSIKAEMSLLNTAYEGKEILQLARTLASLRSLKTYTRFIGNYLQNGSFSAKAKNTLKQISKMSASNYLQWKFAVRPLISDIEAVYSSLSSYKSRMNDLVTRTGGRQTRHFTVHLDEFTDSDETVATGFLRPWIGFNGCVPFEANRRIQYSPTVFHCQVQYNFNYTAYQQQNAAVLGLLDMLGVNFNPAIVWNALPWSFVVDWVLRVGDSLERFATPNMEPRINIHQFLWSVKRSRRIYVRTRPNSLVQTQLEGHLSRQWITLPLVKEEAYGRFLDYPVDEALVQASGLNSNEFSLGAALVVANSGRRRR